MISDLIFDFDGTLADSAEICFNLFNEIAREHGYRTLARGELGEMKPLSYAERCRRLGIPFWRVPFLSIEARRRYHHRMDALQPFPQIPATVRELAAAGCRLHILSSNTVANIRRFLERHEIAIFETIVSERSFFGKHLGLQRLLRKHRLAADDVIYVGDEVRDIEACRRTGLPVAAVAWGFDTEGTLRVAQPDWLLRAPGEIVALAAGRLPRSVMSRP